MGAYIGSYRGMEGLRKGHKRLRVCMVKRKCSCCYKYDAYALGTMTGNRERLLQM